MKFVDVYLYPDQTKVLHALYVLLGERTKNQSISHKEMPSLDKHIKFVESLPYPHWYLIFANDEDDACVGAIYLTQRNEIGIGIFKDCQNNGYASEAIKQLMSLHSCKFLANINPENKASIKLFENLGFKHIQETLAYES